MVGRTIGRLFLRVGPAASLAAALVAGCSEGGSVTGPRIATIRLVSGNGQLGPIGSQLAAPLVIGMVDQDEVPIAGAEIVWAISGNGTVTPQRDTTDADGLAQTTVVLGSTIGVQTVTGSFPGVTPVVFSLNATAAPPSRLLVAAGSGQTAPAGATLPNDIVVRVTDLFDNPKAAIPIIFAVSAGAGVVAIPGGNPAAAVVAVTDAQGLARVRWTLGPIAGPQTVTASFGNLPDATFTATATP